jgi:hypothetical protein
MAAWHLFIYRLPANPSRTRVAVWRELRRLGALPLQQSVVVVPHEGGLAAQLEPIEARILGEDGTVYHFRLDDLPAEQQERLVAEWNQLRDHEYAEIVEECGTKFRREIEFELFRGNLTGSEAEEIEADLEKIRAWFARVQARDVFAAAGRAEAEAAIEASQRLLDSFIERVFEAESARGGLSLELPAAFSWDGGREPEGGEREPDVDEPASRQDEPRAKSQ